METTNTRDTGYRVHTVGQYKQMKGGKKHRKEVRVHFFCLLISPSNKAHHAAQPTSAILSTRGARWLLLLLLHLLSRDCVCCRHVRVILWELRIVGLALGSLDGLADPHVDDVIRGQSPHDELPCRRRDARDARLARRVERDAIAANAPQFRVRVFGEVNGLLFFSKMEKKSSHKKAAWHRPIVCLYIYKLSVETKQGGYGGVE